jgi:hypothetical protein
MGYNPSIPQASDFISLTQNQVLANYSQMYIQFANDHVMFDADEDVNRGKHKKLTLVEQSGDQTTAATDFAWYAKNDAGAPELYGRSESDGTVFKWTKLGRVSPALRLEAYVLFDSQGNIIEDKNGNNLSYNVSSITIPNALINGINIIDDWIVNFETSLSTSSPFWVVNGFYGPSQAFPSAVNLFTSTTPYMFGTYANAISSTQFRIMTKNVNGSSTPSNLLTKLIQLQVYTVA